MQSSWSQWNKQCIKQYMVHNNNKHAMTTIILHDAWAQIQNSKCINVWSNNSNLIDHYLSLLHHYRRDNYLQLGHHALFMSSLFEHLMSLFTFFHQMTQKNQEWSYMVPNSQLSEEYKWIQTYINTLTILNLSSGIMQCYCCHCMLAAIVHHILFYTLFISLRPWAWHL